jgi:hypothetical protein
LQYSMVLSCTPDSGKSGMGMAPGGLQGVDPAPDPRQIGSAPDPRQIGDGDGDGIGIGGSVPYPGCLGEKTSEPAIINDYVLSPLKIRRLGARSSFSGHSPVALTSSGGA